MKTVNMHDAKTHFSKLVDRVSDGETVVIAKAGRPVARLVPLAADAERSPQRTGFLTGSVPDDFDHLGADEIAAAFAAGE